MFSSTSIHHEMIVKLQHFLKRGEEGLKSDF